MLIFVDHRAPQQAIEKLGKYGEVVPFATSGITYDSISGHPDVFICKTDEGLVVAPNTPTEYLDKLRQSKVNWVFGSSVVGKQYPTTAHYNAATGSGLLIHNPEISDPVILNHSGSSKFIHVRQGYSSCTIRILAPDRVITSDHGIRRILSGKDINCCYADPSGIILPGQQHGFFGGCTGVLGNLFFLMGSFIYLHDYKDLREYISVSGYEIEELYDGPPYDGGGILFIE